MRRSIRYLAAVALLMSLVDPAFAALRSRELAGAKREFVAAINVRRGDAPLAARLDAIRAFAAVPDDRVFKELFRALEPLDREVRRAQAAVARETEEVDEIWEKVRRWQEQQARATGGKPPNSMLASHNQELSVATAKQRIAARQLDLVISVREAVAAGMGTFLAGLSQEDREEVWDASVRLGKRSSDPDERAAFLRALGELRGPEVVATLLELEEDEDEIGVRMAALGALAEHRDDERTFPRLVERLDDPAWQIVAAAIRGLARFRNARVVPTLAERLETAETRIFADLVETLTAITGKHIPDRATAWKKWWERDGEAFLARWAKDPEVRIAEIEKIASAGSEGIDPTAELIALDRGEEDPIVRVAIVEALGRQTAAAARQALIRRIDGEDPRLRLAVIDALGSFRHLRAVHALVRRSAEADDTERAAIGRSLAAIWGEDEKEPFPLKETSRIAIEDFWLTHRGRFAKRLRDLEKADEDGPAERQVDARDRTFYGLPLYSERVLFVLDVSGSMIESATEGGERSKIDVAKAELRRAITGLPDDAVFGVIVFSSSASVWGNGMMEANPKLRERALEEIEELQANGGTNLFDSLELAFLLGTPESPLKSSEGSPDTIYLVSDGAPTSGKFVEPETILKHIAIMNRERGVKIHSIGIGDAHDAKFLRELSEANGGTYVKR